MVLRRTSGWVLVSALVVGCGSSGSSSPTPGSGAGNATGAVGGTTGGFSKGGAGTSGGMLGAAGGMAGATTGSGATGTGGTTGTGFHVPGGGSGGGFTVGVAGSSGTIVGGGGSDGTISGSGGSTSVCATGAPSIVGHWLTQNASNTYSELTLNADGTYLLEILVETSAVTGDDYIQEGTYVLDGASATFTATEHTCSATLVTPVVYAYAIDGQYLVLANSSATTAYVATTATTLASAGMTLVVGCSVNNGEWMPVALTGTAPVPPGPIVSPSPFGDWSIFDGNQTYAQLTLNTSGTYQLVAFIPTSTVTGDEYVQQGTFAFDCANVIFTPTLASCTGAKTAFTDSYLLNGTNLELTDSSGNKGTWAHGAIDFGGRSLVVGCTLNNVFTPEPLQ